MEPCGIFCAMVLKCKIRRGWTVHSRVRGLRCQRSCTFPSHYNNLRWRNALSHKLEVGNGVLASHYTLTTASAHFQVFRYSCPVYRPYYCNRFILHRR